MKWEHGIIISNGFYPIGWQFLLFYTKPRDGISVYHIRPRREQESNSSADINAADDNRPVVGHGGKMGVGRAA